MGNGEVQNHDSASPLHAHPAGSPPVAFRQGAPALRIVFRVRAQRIVEERRQGDRSTPFVAHGTQLKAAPDPAGGRPLSTMTRGCLAGTAVCFVSNVGDVYPCGYLPVTAGSVRKQPFGEIWRESDVFGRLRDPEAFEGKCGLPLRAYS